MGVAVGIDLGTVNSVLAVYKDNSVQIIKIDGEAITPSFVYYDYQNIENVEVGNEMKAANFPANGIYDVKRMIGRSFSDECIKNQRDKYPFEIARTPNNGIKIKIFQENDLFYKTPQEVSAEILKKFKQVASSYIGSEVNEAVITVPAYFNFAQRHATKEAAELAGLKVLMLLNEPTAAGISYISEKNKSDNISMVFDLGGGTFDISIIRMVGNKIETIGVDGDTFLGGRNFDDSLFEYVIKRDNLNLEKREMRRLRSKLKEMKQKLSYQETCSSEIEFLINDKNLIIKLTRDEFEKCNDKLFRKCIAIMDKCLQEVYLEKDQIKQVILVGGSSKIPKIRELITNYFGKKPLADVSPDDTVARGAALQAAYIKGYAKDIFDIIDVTPISLGIALYGDKMLKMFKSNQTIPASYSHYIITTENYQTIISIEVYEGERSRCKLNNLLGKFSIKNLPSKPIGMVKVLVTFTIDESGLLKVSAKEELSGISSCLEVGIKLFDFKSKHQMTLCNALEEDQKFEDFVKEKEEIRKPYIKYLSKGYVDAKCIQCANFVNEIDNLDYEDRNELYDVIDKFKITVRDQSLINKLPDKYKDC